MSFSKDDLLQPSLGGASGEVSATAIYSATTGYVASFFGGPVAGAVIALLNARRLNRLAKDWPVALAALALVAAVVWWEQRMGGDEWLKAHVGNSAGSVVFRLLGIAFFCGIYGLHYRSYRGMDRLGIEAPSGWVAGLVAILAGIGTFFAFAMAFRS
jgi:hypothetical protein